MKKWFLVEDIYGKNEDIATVLNSEDESCEIGHFFDACYKVSKAWAEKTEEEQNAYDGFYMVLADTDEDDFSWADAIESCDITRVYVGDIFDDPTGQYEITEIEGEEVIAVDTSDGNECNESIAEAAYFLKYGLKGY